MANKYFIRLEKSFIQKIFKIKPNLLKKLLLSLFKPLNKLIENVRLKLELKIKRMSYLII